MYEWNSKLLPEYEGKVAIINGIEVVIGSKVPEKVLEAIYNDPNRKGLVIKKEKESKTQK